MVTMAERKEMIARLKQLPTLLEAATRGLDDQRLDTPYGAGKWTPRQVVHHLADSHMNAFIRLKLVLTEDEPMFRPYNQDEWAMTADSIGMPIDTSLAIVRGLHARWSALLEQLPESSWQRGGMHPERGKMTLDDLLKLYAGHGEKHVGHITGLRAARGW